MCRSLLRHLKRAFLKLYKVPGRSTGYQDFEVLSGTASVLVQPRMQRLKLRSQFVGEPPYKRLRIGETLLSLCDQLLKSLGNLFCPAAIRVLLFYPAAPNFSELPCQPPENLFLR